MKTILVPFHDEPAATVALETAYLVAQRFGSYIEGLNVRRTPQIIAGDGMVIPPEAITQLADEGRKLGDDARAYNAFMDERKVPFREVSFTRERITAGWRELEGQENQVVGDYGRLFDLIVVARASDPRSADWNVTFEGALFESGRPVMVAPTASPSKLGESIVVAWNGSTETARTIGLGMPFLCQAKQVTVLTVEGGTVPGPTGEQVAQHLVRNGVPARATTAHAGGRSVGEAILNEAGQLGADLLLKGAYTQHRLRQLIFGGPTRHILSYATIPVFFAH